MFQKYRNKPDTKEDAFQQISLFDFLKPDIGLGSCVGPESCGQELSFWDAYGMQHRDVIVQNPYVPEILRVMRVHQPVRRMEEPFGLVFSYGNTATRVYEKAWFEPGQERRFRIWAIA